MLIYDYATRYCLRNGGSDGYLEQLQVFLRRLPWQVESITTAQVDQYLTEALKTLSPTTVSNHRRYLTTLAHAARRDGLAPDFKPPFRRVKSRIPPPKAFSRAEISRVLARAEQLGGELRGCPRRHLLSAWILAAYCTGLRSGDLHSLRWDDMRGNRVYLTQHKTGRAHVALLTTEAQHSLNKIPRRQYVWADYCALNTMQKWVASASRGAGLKGNTKTLRKSSATYAAILGLSPQHHLGHLTNGLAEKHYIVS